MFGPGEYVPDPTEGIVDVKALPAPQLAYYTVATSKPLARAVGTWPLATNPTSVCYTTWAIDIPVVPLTPGDLRVARLCQLRKHFNIDSHDWPRLAVITRTV